MADIFEIAGRIHSTSQEKVAVTADEVLDGTKKQSQINTETYGHVESIDNALANLSPEQQEALGVAAKANNNEANIGFYVCDTAAGTAAKAITSANYVLTVGGSIKIKFEHANSAASGVTLKVGSAMAKPLYYDGTAVSVNNTWEDNETVEVYYDGTNYYANNVAGSGGAGVFDVSEKYPTSGVEGGNTYTLEGALAVLNANLPASKKKGGMSIKFVQSSDNKYIRYNLIADEFTTDVTKWAIDDVGVYVENPEWIYVILDSQKRILAGIKSDGSVEWSIGVPTPVKKYIEDAIAEIKNGTEGTDLDGLNKIITFLSELSTSATLKDLLDTKVDKEEDKSLIDSEYAGSVHFVENPEFIEIHTDANGNILWAIKTDGDIYFGAGVPKQIVTFVKLAVEIFGAYQDNPEFLKLIKDSNDNILFGIRKDGDVIFGNGVPSAIRVELGKKVDSIIGKGLINETYADSISYTDSTEYLDVKLDVTGRILIGIKKNGEIYYGAGVPQQIVDFVNNVINNVVIPNYFIAGGNQSYSPLIRENDNKPLVYEINKWAKNVVTYPDGTIFCGNIGGNSIIKIEPDGTKSTVLSLTGAGNGYQMLYMDSHKNIYASPSVVSSSYSNITGLYKLSYGQSSFNPTPVLSLASYNKTYRIWTMTEDREGNLYAGVYGQPYCPYIYKSTDGGDTWSFLKDMSVYATGGIHIHFIQYNRYDNALYCTVGEVNKLLKSTDGGVNWIDMNVTLYPMKSCSILCVEDGLILGSDYGYDAMLYKVYTNGTYKITARAWANAIFSIRESDVTGWLYAFGVIDAAADNMEWYPPKPLGTDTEEEVIAAWETGTLDPIIYQGAPDHIPVYLSEWQDYHDRMLSIYPDDAVRPTHSMVLISKDRGESWEILCRIEGQSTGIGSHFRNGECCVALAPSQNKTIVISEGTHKYGASGVDVSDNILYKLNLL